MLKIFQLIYGKSRTFPHSPYWLDNVVIFYCSDRRSTNTVGSNLDLLAENTAVKSHACLYLFLSWVTWGWKQGAIPGDAPRSICFQPGYWFNSCLFICRVKVLPFALCHLGASVCFSCFTMCPVPTRAGQILHRWSLSHLPFALPH